MTPNYVVIMQLFGPCLGFAVLKKNLSLLEVLEFTPAASATTKGVPGMYTKFSFHFPFDEIYRRLLFFTLGRSVSA